jgi:type IV pilus assembly protein PilX
MAAQKNSYISQQKGISLITVMVITLLSILLALTSGRLAYLNEVRAGNDTDYQRALEAAQALLVDAQIDITMGSTDFTKRAEGYQINVNDPDQIGNLLTQVDGLPSDLKCNDAVCTDLKELVFGDPENVFWNKADKLKAYWDVGAKYGQYTGRGFSSMPDKNANPRLIEDPNVAVPPPQNVQGAKYWIEILYADKPNAAWAQECINSSSDANYLFRITAIAMARAGKPAVVQEVFVLSPGGLAEVRRCPNI